MESKELLENIVRILDEKKATDIVAIENADVTIMSDFFIIASATSSTHVRSLADDVEDGMEKLGVRPDHIEGKATGWILLDYSSVVVHVFQNDTREYYNLERLWADAPRVDLTHLRND